MIALSDESLTMLMHLAAPLHPTLRSQFLAEVAEQLRGKEIGGGLVARIAAAVQKRYLHPPTIRAEPHTRVAEPEGGRNRSRSY
jgi:hypothetical protein